MSRPLRSLTALFALLGAASLAAVGCESVESAVPPTVAATPDAATLDAATPTPDAASSTDAGTVDAATPTDGAIAADAAHDAGEPDCFAQPQTSAQILNQCTTRGCVPFDNRARLPLLYADGGAPPLP